MFPPLCLSVVAVDYNFSHQKNISTYFLGKDDGNGLFFTFLSQLRLTNLSVSGVKTNRILCLSTVVLSPKIQS